jgi:hypothetical protein
MGVPSVRKWEARKPPITVPNTRIKFHLWVRQSKEKKEAYLPAPARVQNVRRLEDIPKDLPKYTKSKSTMAIKGPDTYHGQGFNSSSTRIRIKDRWKGPQSFSKYKIIRGNALQYATHQDNNGHCKAEERHEMKCVFFGEKH